ncbi:hypothetical protein PVAP13_4KG040616 [Panicum virgatum]|uniref:Uncharacterized protein n=1 Tax=Panicum virgatum TaxID=38727 RepID=A0A8T0TKH0_PANVG|nr:hypothetical protein PVAP13_4KG040616 [Panicum virgatum]
MQFTVPFSSSVPPGLDEKLKRLECQPTDGLHVHRDTNGDMQRRQRNPSPKGWPLGHLQFSL